MIVQQRIILGARVVLGLVFFIVGVIGLLNLAQIPTRTNAAYSFLQAMQSTGYLYKVVNAVEFICGAGLMLGFFVPLALVLLAPILLNILLYTMFLDQTGLAISVIVLAVYLFQVYAYRMTYVAIFQMKPEPTL